jgi:two-component system OmpR family response regulator
MCRIVVVEDVPELREDVCLYLQNAGYVVESAEDSIALTALMPTFAPDIVILDVGLPGEDGLQIAARLREQQPQIGIVMLTGRSALHDRLAGHRLGADHYLSKPVQFDELVLVLRNLQRRLVPREESCWTLMLSDLRLSAPQGEPVAVTRTEARMLETLARAAHRQVSRQDLVTALGEVWGVYDLRRLEALISRLRRKLARACGREAPLRAVRGEGYAFVEALRLK